MKPDLRIVLFVHVIDQVGGAEVATRRWAVHLVARGHDVTLIGSQPMSRWIRSRKLIARENGLRVIRVPVWQRTRRLAELQLVFNTAAVLLFLCRGRKLLHLRGFMEDTLKIARWAKRLGMKVVCGPMAAGAYGDVATLPKTLSINAANGVDWVSCLTATVREEVVQWGFPPEKTSINPNGVDTNYYTPAGAAPNLHSAMFVGQFRVEKRIDLLLEAWRMIQLDFPDARLTLVGGGERREEYERKAGEMGVQAQFLPILPPEGVLEQLRQHAVFIMSGVSEGMSNALLEGMAVGLAPVVSDTPGNRALVTPGVNGLTYESESAEALANALRQLFESPELAQQFGRAARETVVRGYSLESVVDRYESLYRKLLNAD